MYIQEKTKIKPLFYGGGQQRGLRSGTENVPAIAGFGLAAEEAYRDLEQKVQHMYKLREHAFRELALLSGVSVNGAQGSEAAPHIISVSVEGVRAEVLLHALEERSVYVSSGSACSSNKPSVSRTLKAIGLKEPLLDATIRLSFCETTTLEEVDYALSVMKEVIPMLQKYIRR